MNPANTENVSARPIVTPTSLSRHSKTWSCPTAAVTNSVSLWWWPIALWSKKDAATQC